MPELIEIKANALRVDAGLRDIRMNFGSAIVVKYYRTPRVKMDGTKCSDRMAHAKLDFLVGWRLVDVFSRNGELLFLFSSANEKKHHAIRWAMGQGAYWAWMPMEKIGVWQQLQFTEMEKGYISRLNMCFVFLNYPHALALVDCSNTINFVQWKITRLRKPKLVFTAFTSSIPDILDLTHEWVKVAYANVTRKRESIFHLNGERVL